MKKKICSIRNDSCHERSYCTFSAHNICGSRRTGTEHCHFQGGYGDAYWNQMVELFEASHEGVKVNMTISPTIGDIIRPQIVAGNAPDFICLNDGGEDGVILSLIKRTCTFKSGRCI